MRLRAGDGVNHWLPAVGSPWRGTRVVVITAGGRCLRGAAPDTEPQVLLDVVVEGDSMAVAAAVLEIGRAHV